MRLLLFFDLLWLLNTSADIFVLNNGNGTLGRYDDAGKAEKTTFIGSLPQPTGVAIDNGYIYISLEQGTVSKYTLDGAPVNRQLIHMNQEPFDGIAVANGFIYLASSRTPSHLGRVEKFTTDGVPVAPVLIDGFENPGSLAVSGQDLYVADWTAGRIGKYTTSGEPVIPNLHLVPYPNGLTFDAQGHLLYMSGTGALAVGLDGNLLRADNYGGPGGNVVRKFSPSGELLDPAFIQGLSNPIGLAVVVPEPSSLTITAAGVALSIAAGRLARSNAPARRPLPTS